MHKVMTFVYPYSDPVQVFQCCMLKSWLSCLSCLFENNLVCTVQCSVIPRDEARHSDHEQH